MTDADADFLTRMENLERWYNGASGRWSFTLNACKVTSFLASFVTIVVAAAVDKDFFAGEGRWIIVAASLMTAGTSELLAQLKVREKENLRETGRIEAADIVETAKLAVEEFAHDPVSLFNAKREILNRVRSLEERQHRQDFDLGSPHLPPPAPPSVVPASTPQMTPPA